MISPPSRKAKQEKKVRKKAPGPGKQKKEFVSDGDMLRNLANTISQKREEESLEKVKKDHLKVQLLDKQKEIKSLQKERKKLSKHEPNLEAMRARLASQKRLHKIRRRKEQDGGPSMKSKSVSFAD